MLLPEEEIGIMNCQGNVYESRFYTESTIAVTKYIEKQTEGVRY